MRNLVNAMKSLVGGLSKIAERNQSQSASSRFHAEEFNGEFRRVAEGINNLLAEQSAVLRKTSVCINEFAKGNFDVPLERFSGEQAVISQGVEELRNNVKKFITEMQHMSDEHAAGDVDVMIDPENFSGDFAKMARGVDDMVGAHLQEKAEIIHMMRALGDGDFGAEVKQYPGKKAEINKSLERLEGKLKGIVDSVKWVTNEHVQGNIDMSLHAHLFKGGFK